MKTNVIFKSGLNLVCDVVKVDSAYTFLYVHNLTDSKRIEMMNYALTEKWSCEQVDMLIHPKALRLMVKTELIERFNAVL